MKMMTWILNCGAPMIKLLHKLLFKFIIVIHPIFIVVKLTVIFRVELFLIKLLIIALEVKLLLCLRPRCPILTHRRVDVYSSTIFYVVPIVIL
jgi:hypothetical protein